MSKLRGAQSAFCQDIGKFIAFAFANGIELTIGEGYRTEEQQKIYLETGKTTVSHSNHQDRLAMDFNFFIDGDIVWDKDRLKILGDYWESLNLNNRWGGFWENFVDTPHFERRV
jgi:hypothetical protein